MEQFPLNLADLKPQGAAFKLSPYPEQTFNLCPWSLRIRAWAQLKYGPAGLQEIFAKQQIVEIGEMAYFMLKEKEFFKTQDAFLDGVQTVQDQINLMKALLQTIGFGEPEIAQLEKSLPKETPPPKPKAPVKKSKRIGAKSLTR